MNTQLAKLVEAAFDYHPFRWNAPRSVEGYAVGPTFMAYCPGFTPEERVSVYTKDAGTKSAPAAKSMLAYPPDTDPELTVLKDAHKRMRTKENCKARALALGEYEMDIELAYPLYKLMRFYKPDRFAVENGVLYAWDGERIVFVGMTRTRFNNCMGESDVIEEE